VTKTERAAVLEVARKRQDSIGPLRLLAKAEGWCMVRRPGCAPFVMHEKEWTQLPSLEAIQEAKDSDG
jgi:hypothetical protein